MKTDKDYPKKPFLSGDKNFWVCPGCKKYLRPLETGKRYCNGCGQALDWNVL